MTAAVVCDSSVVVALLVDPSDVGRWAADILGDAALLAPHLLPFEVTNVLRRLEMQGALSADAAAQARRDLLSLAIEFWPYELLSERIWRLRSNVTAYDASYVATAELNDAPLATLDKRLTRAAGVHCRFLIPGA